MTGPRRSAWAVYSSEYLDTKTQEPKGLRDNKQARLLELQGAIGVIF